MSGIGGVLGSILPTLRYQSRNTKKDEKDESNVFELCRRTQQPSLTFCLVGGSTLGFWPLFHLRDGGKWTEMTATQHWGTLRHYFLTTLR
jgi:hypothetical protein